MKQRISETFKIKNMILISCLIPIALIGFVKFMRYAMDRYVEIELEDQSWVDNLLNKILNDEETETNLIS